MERRTISELNRAAWNEAAAVHEELSYENLLEAFRQPGFSCVPGIRREALLREGLEGKALAQPCCNNGREVLSIKNLGAARCVGFDLSDAFIEQGRRLREISEIECELVQTDVYEIPHCYEGQFDIVYVTAGSIRCLPDLDGFFSAMVRLMKPGAWLFMHEIHPIVDMFGMEPSKPPRRLRHSYFATGPCEIRGGLDYYRVRRYRAKRSILFHHTLSDVVQACASSGLRVETLEESRHDVSGGTYRPLRRRRAKLPLSFTLSGRLE